MVFACITCDFVVPVHTPFTAITAGEQITFQFEISDWDHHKSVT